MKFKIEFLAEVQDHDADIMALVPDMISDRFSGTAIQVTSITVTKKEEADLVPPALRAQLTEADWNFLHMMRGSKWGPGAQVTLPSGLLLSEAEVASLLPKE